MAYTYRLSCSKCQAFVLTDQVPSGVVFMVESNLIGEYVPDWHRPIAIIVRAPLTCLFCGYTHPRGAELQIVRTIHE